MESLKRTRSDIKPISLRRNSVKRRRSSTDARCNENAVLIDNGGYALKIGYGRDEKPRVMPNAILKSKAERKRIFIGDQIDDCRDLSGLYYNFPHKQGYIADFDLQKEIWDYALNNYNLEDNTVLLSQPICNSTNVQEFQDEVFFEDYGVNAMFVANSTDYAFYNYAKEFQLPSDQSALVIDSGFSFTHIVPYIKGKKYAKGILRLNLGGKLLTNYLKDLISYRQLNVMEETYVINQLKEDSCFMAINFNKEMRRDKLTHDLRVNYVLPDFYTLRRGFLQHPSETITNENCQVLRLGNERIIVPEILMSPCLIPGIHSAGVAECLAESILRCPQEYQAEICRNVVLCGGTAMFKGFRQRLEDSARCFIPCDCELKVYHDQEAQNYAWYGAKAMTMNAELKSWCVTKQEYEEYGSNYVFQSFNKYYRHERAKNNKNSEKAAFSYLNYWKTEDIDLFGKLSPRPLKEPNVQFTLEGDDIEQYDGKYVTIEFEYAESEENQPPEEKEKLAETTRLRLRKVTNTTPTTITSTTTSYTLLNKMPPVIISSIGLNNKLKSSLTTAKRAHIVDPNAGPSRVRITKLANSSANVLNSKSEAIPKVSLASIFAKNAQNPPKVINSNITLPKLTAIQSTKVIRPIGKATGQSKITNIKTMNLSEAFVIPGTNAKSVTTNKILNNAVIVPQHTASGKNLTFQIIPIRSDGKSSNITIIKKPN